MLPPLLYRHAALCIAMLRSASAVEECDATMLPNESAARYIMAKIPVLFATGKI